jgi:peptide/nickel transport system permease protein
MTARRGALRHPRIVLPGAFLAVELVACLGAHWLAPYPAQQADFAASLSGPTAQHLLGTDRLGRDVLSRLMFGGADMFRQIAIAVLVTTLLAVPLGLVAALVRGWVDAALMRTADVVMSVPSIIVLLIVLTLFSQSMTAVMVVVGLLSVPGAMRVIRSASLSVAKETYVAAARVSGLRTGQLALRHILPRVMGLVAVSVALLAANAILLAAGLTFIGLGIRPPAPSWGGMIADASQVLSQSLWLVVPTGATVALTAGCLLILGDGVRDALAARWAGTQGRAPKKSTRPVPAGAPGAGRLAPAVIDQPDPVVRLSGVTVSVPGPDGEVDLIRDVSLTVGRGRSVGLVGESGCGKSMTGLALLGMLPAGARITRGTVEIDGVDVSTLNPRGRRALRGGTIAFISQEPMVALDPLFTIGHLLREAVRTHEKVSRRQAAARARELLVRVQIPDPDRVLRLRPAQISGGMAQRVSIAVALAGRPRILVADEPTTALDVTVQREIVQLLRTIQRDTGMALLIISHDWDVIAEACDTALVMYAGEIVEGAAAARVIAEPVHPYTRALLAANPRLALVGQAIPTIPGVVPAPGHWPAGCHFADRCGFTLPTCTQAPVPLLVHDPGGLARCVRADEIVGAAR